MLELFSDYRSSVRVEDKVACDFCRDFFFIILFLENGRAVLVNIHLFIFPSKVDLTHRTIE